MEYTPHPYILSKKQARTARAIRLKSLAAFMTVSGKIAQSLLKRWYGTRHSGKGMSNVELSPSRGCVCALVARFVAASARADPLCYNRRGDAYARLRLSLGPRFGHSPQLLD